MDIDPGKTAPRQRHPGEEIIYVLEGSRLITIAQIEGRVHGAGSEFVAAP